MSFHGIPFYKEEKVAIFIDGSNLYAAAKSLDFDIDYKSLLKWASTRGKYKADPSDEIGRASGRERELAKV